jgi:predicted acylesterase/phospholipase RssA
MTRPGQKIAFAFAGGGSRGAIQVGMLDVLLSARVQPDFVVGASVGAKNAAYWRKLAQDVVRIRRAQKLASLFTRAPVRRAPWH